MKSAGEFMLQNTRALLVVTLVLMTVSLTATLLGTAWTDEVFYVSPGGNWAVGKGFTSNNWIYWEQPKTWGFSNPGLPVLLGLWFKVFGFGQIQSHAFIFLVYLAGLIGLVRWVGKRYQMSMPQLAVGVWIGLFVHSFSHDAIYHARHDCFWPFLFWGFLKLSLDEGKSHRTRLLNGTLLGLACIFLGLHFAGFFAVAAATLFLYHRNKVLFYAGLGQALGLILGLILLRFIYDKMGVWGDFVDHRSMHFARSLKWAHWVVSKDFWLIGPGLVLLLLGEFLAGRGAGGHVGRTAIIGLGLFVLIPPVINAVGYYQASYSWMVIAPICLVVMPRLICQPFMKGGWFNCLVLLLMTGGIFLRSFDMIQGMFEYGRRQEVRQVAAGLMAASDPVLVSTGLYYDFGDPGNNTHICYENRAQVPAAAGGRQRWLILNADDAKLFKVKLDGVWEVAYESPMGRLMMPHGNYVIMRKLP